MATSAQVAKHAGVSRSTVSQILNGHEDLFTEDTVERVRASARELGYRPSVAGRTLVRGTSDIVITLVPDVTFNPRLRELIDIITEGLASAGLTNLLRFAGSHDSLHDAILGLRPYGVISLSPLHPDERERLSGQGVQVIEQSTAMQAAIDRAIGRLQARHLTSSGYNTIAVALPTGNRERAFAPSREEGVRQWCTEHGVRALPTFQIALQQDDANTAIRELSGGPVGIAAYNDEIALALLSAAQHQGRDVPEDVGIVGIDNSPVAHATTPTITTVDYDIKFSGREIVKMILQEPAMAVDESGELEVEKRLTIVQGGTTRTP